MLALNRLAVGTNKGLHVALLAEAAFQSHTTSVLAATSVLAISSVDAEECWHGMGSTAWRRAAASRIIRTYSGPTLLGATARCHHCLVKLYQGPTLLWKHSLEPRWPHIYVHVCAHTHTLTRTRAHTHIHIHTRTHAHMHARVHARTNVRMYEPHGLMRHEAGLVSYSRGLWRTCRCAITI